MNGSDSRRSLKMIVGLWPRRRNSQPALFISQRVTLSADTTTFLLFQLFSFLFLWRNFQAPMILISNSMRQPTLGYNGDWVIPQADSVSVYCCRVHVTRATRRPNSQWTKDEFESSRSLAIEFARRWIASPSDGRAPPTRRTVTAAASTTPSFPVTFIHSPATTYWITPVCHHAVKWLDS